MSKATAKRGGALPAPASNAPPVNAVSQPGVQMFDIARQPGGATLSTFIPDSVLLTIYTGTNLRANLSKMVETCEFREIGMTAPPKPKPTGAAPGTKRAAMTPAARRKISLAQKKRHAEAKRGAGAPQPAVAGAAG